jgi:hypothetical protein
VLYIQNSKKEKIALLNTLEIKPRSEVYDTDFYSIVINGVVFDIYHTKERAVEVKEEVLSLLTLCTIHTLPEK